MKISCSISLLLDCDSKFFSLSPGRHPHHLFSQRRCFGTVSSTVPIWQRAADVSLLSHWGSWQDVLCFWCICVHRPHFFIFLIFLIFPAFFLLTANFSSFLWGRDDTWDTKRVGRDRVRQTQIPKGFDCVCWCSDSSAVDAVNVPLCFLAL